ncbi:maleylpyruvate isomerase family mycothiol-dependent enzyme [Kineosporia sp. J2-2]|uniref:Maleylpyruvate isomerase family mycothiol-dependent enzyme n=1 Tax=Kineosporia corallincola TaxID=2835133 RepID=A0ABS5TND4_9ACTN|nr:maleylpyruvate isomerase family mycothiol-dependent enzyme [Kineosporia corallincola]MBT0772608.1 maleylpyruvate isomerase family mycothiol-dependent enzyme [Kineosporia corallincola]
MTEINFLAVVERETERFAVMLETADLGVPVPTCPGWSLHDLADHVGGVHRWARHAIVEGVEGDDPPAAPGDRAGLVDWYRESAAGLLAALRELPADAPAWHFGTGPQVAGWWRRRQAHEITMHLWDARNALGGGEPVDPVLAADGVDEARHVFFPRQVRLGRMPALDRSLAVVVAETGRRHVFSGDGTGTSGEEPADATVTGPAEALLLALWHRIPADDPRLLVEGDRSAAIEVLSAKVTA